MFETTIAGSLPKPSWLAEPEKLWAPWQLKGEELIRGKQLSRNNDPANTSVIIEWHYELLG